MHDFISSIILSSLYLLFINFILFSHFNNAEFALVGHMACLCTWSVSSMRSLGILGFVLQITFGIERLLQTWMIVSQMQHLKNSIRASKLGQLIMSIMFPIFIFQLLKFHLRNCRSDATCIICREEMTVAKKLVCGHLFHVHCLRSWLERQHTCPTCRALVVPPEGSSTAGGHQGSQSDANQQGNCKEFSLIYCLAKRS